MCTGTIERTTIRSHERLGRPSGTWSFLEMATRHSGRCGGLHAGLRTVAPPGAMAEARLRICRSLIRRLFWRTKVKRWRQRSKEAGKRQRRARRCSAPFFRHERRAGRGATRTILQFYCDSRIAEAEDWTFSSSPKLSCQWTSFSLRNQVSWRLAYWRVDCWIWGTALAMACD
jgi:hypothetical protein